MNRRGFLAGLMAGGVIVAGELWIPGQKLISIPKPSRWGTFSGGEFFGSRGVIIEPEPNVVTFNVTGLDVGDYVYCAEIDAHGNHVDEVYRRVKHLT